MPANFLSLWKVRIPSVITLGKATAPPGWPFVVHLQKVRLQAVEQRRLPVVSGTWWTSRVSESDARLCQLQTFFPSFQCYLKQRFTPKYSPCQEKVSVSSVYVVLHLKWTLTCWFGRLLHVVRCEPCAILIYLYKPVEIIYPGRIKRYVKIK